MEQQPENSAAVMKKLFQSAFSKSDEPARSRASLAISMSGEESPYDRSIREIRLLLSQYSVSSTSEADKCDLFISLVRTYLSIADANNSVHDTMDVNGIFRGDLKLVKIVAEHVWENVRVLTVEDDVELWSYPQMLSRLAVPSSRGPSLLECIRFLRVTPFSQKSVCDLLVQSGLPTSLCALARFFCRLSFDLAAADSESVQLSVMVYDMLRQFSGYPAAVADIVRINRPKMPSGIEMLFQALCIPVVCSSRCHDDALRFVSMLIFDKKFDGVSFQNMQHVQVIEMSLKSLKIMHQQPAVRRSIANWVIAICELVVLSPLLRNDFDQCGGYQTMTQIICWIASLSDDEETGHEIEGLVRVLMRMCFASIAEPAKRSSLLAKMTSANSSKETNTITNIDALNSIISMFVSNTSEFLSRICLNRFTELLGMSPSNYIASKSITALPVALGMIMELSQELRLELLTTLVLVSTSVPTHMHVPTAATAPVEELELLADLVRNARCSPECCTDILDTVCKIGSYSETNLRMLRDHRVLEAALDRLHSVLSRKLREILPNAGADATQYHMQNIRNLEFDRDSGMIISAVLSFCNKIMTISPCGIQNSRFVRLKSLDAFILLIDAPAFRRQSIVLLHQLALRSPDSLSHDVEKIMKLLETFALVPGNFSVKSDLCSLLSAIFRDSSVARGAFAKCDGFKLTLHILHELQNTIVPETETSHHEDILKFMMSVLGLICSAGRGRLGESSGSDEDDVVFMEQDVELATSRYVPTGVPLSKDGPSAQFLLLSTVTPQLVASVFHGSGIVGSRYAYFVIAMLLEASLGTADQPLLFPRSIITRINTDAMSVEFFDFDLAFVESFQTQKIEIPNQTVIQHSSFCVASMILCAYVPEDVSSRILTLIAVMICSIPPNANRIALNFGVSATLDLVIRLAQSRQAASDGDFQLFATCLQILSTLCSHFVSTHEAVLLMCACRHPIVGSNIIESLVSSLSAAANSPSVYFLASSQSSKAGRPTKFRSSIEIFGEQSIPGHLVLDVFDENPMLWPPSGGVSFSIWVYIDDYSDSKSVSVLTAVSDTGTALSRIKLYDGNVTYQIAGKEVYMFSSCDLYQHRWHHVCVTHKSTLVGGLGLQSDCYLYVDGVRRQRAQLPYKSSTLFSKDVYVSAFVVGSNGKFEDSSESATWRAGSVLVMSEVLDEQRVRSLFRAGPGSVTTIQGSSYTDKNPEAELSAFICRSEAHDRFLDLPDLSIRLNQDRIIVALAPALAQVMLPDELPKDSVRIRDMMRFFLGLDSEFKLLSFCDDALQSAKFMLAARAASSADDSTARIQFDELCHAQLSEPHQKEASVPDISKWNRSARVMGFSFIMPSRPFADSLQALGGIAPIFTLIEDATTDGNLVLSLSMLSASIQGHVTNTFQFESMNGADLLASILQHHQISKTRKLPTAALVPHLMAIVGWDVARPRLSVVSSIQSCRALLLDSRIWSHDVSVIPQVMECLTGFIEGNTYKKWNCQRLVQAQVLQYVCLNISRGFLDKNSVEKSVLIIQHVLIEMFKNLSTPTSQAQSLDTDLQDVVLLLSFTIQCASGVKKGTDDKNHPEGVSLQDGEKPELSNPKPGSEAISFYSTFRRDILLANDSLNHMSKDLALASAQEENIFLRLQVLRALNVVFISCPNGTVNLSSVKKSVSSNFFVMLLKTEHKETHVAAIRLLLAIMIRVQGYDEFFVETKGWAVLQHLSKGCLCKQFALFASFFICFGIALPSDPNFEVSDANCARLIADASSVATVRLGSQHSMWFLFSLLDDVSQQEKATGIKNEFASQIVISICKMMDQHQSVRDIFTSPEIISCMASVIFSSRTSIKSQSVYESAVVEQSAAVLTESDQAADDFNVFKAAFQNLAGAASAIAADIMDLSLAHHQPSVAEPESAHQANADLNDINGEETRDWDLIGSEEVNASQFMIVNLSSKTELDDIRFELEHKVATILVTACKYCVSDIRKCASLPYLIYESVPDEVPTANVAAFLGESLGEMLSCISKIIDSRSFDVRDFNAHANFAEEFVSASSAGIFPLSNEKLTVVLRKLLETVLKNKAGFEEGADVGKIVRRYRGALLRSLAIGCSAVHDETFYDCMNLGSEIIHLLLPAPGSPGLLDSYLAAFCFALTELFLDDTFPKSRDAALLAWKNLLDQNPVATVVEHLTRFNENGGASSLIGQGFELIRNHDSRDFREWLVNPLNHDLCSRVLKSNVQVHIRTLQSFETRSLRGCSDGFKSKRRVRLERLNRLFPAKSAECSRQIMLSLSNLGIRSEEFLFTMNKRMQARDAQASFAEQSWRQMRADLDVASNVISTTFNDRVWLNRGASISPISKPRDIHSFAPVWSSLFVVRPSPFYKLGPIEGPDSTRLHLVAHHEFLETYQKQLVPRPDSHHSSENGDNAVIEMYGPLPKMTQAAMRADAESLALADPVALSAPLSKKAHIGQLDSASFSSPSKKPTFDLSERFAAFAKDKDEKKTDSVDSLVMRDDRFLWVVEQGDAAQHAFNYVRLKGSERLAGLMLLCNSCMFLFGDLQANAEGELQAVKKEYKQKLRFSDASLNIMTEEMQQGPGRGQGFVEGIHTVEKISFADICEISSRKCLQRPVGIEIFTEGGEGMLFTFNKTERNFIYDFIRQRCPRLRRVADSSDVSSASQSFGGGELKSLQKAWRIGEISNFRYLMLLNLIAGRSFNDYTQYPVMPWIIADYDSDVLDLSDNGDEERRRKTFRDLTKPMGAQGASRAEEFKTRFVNWPDETTPAFHYGTHYSSSAGVMYYLLRLEPFARHHLLLQSGHFDHSDRLFQGLKVSWESSSAKSVGDVKELTPEFFFLPEVFCNAMEFALGFKQNGVLVDDIVLPKWSFNDPVEFIRAHRRALECEYVSANLHHWIDLIFGERQKGELAKESINVFPHLSYEGIDIDSIEDPSSKLAALGQILNFGQTPKQLWHKGAHPARERSSSSPTICGHPSILSSQHLKGVLGRVSSVQICEGNVISVGGFKLLLPPTYTKYISWEKPDGGLRFHTAVVTPRHLRVNELSHLFEHMHASPITACAISDDSSHIVTGAVDGGIAIWEHVKGANSSRTLTLKKRMFGHVGMVTCIRICGLHGIVVSGSVDCSVVMWNMRTGHRLFCVLNIPSTITALDVGPAMGMLWIVAGKSLFITTINGHPLLDMFCSIAITSVAVGPAPEWHDNNAFVTGHEDGSLRFWKLRHEQAFSKPECPADNGATVFQRGRYRAHLIALYNRDTPNFTGEIHSCAVSHIKFLSDIAVVTGSVDGAVLQWGLLGTGQTTHWMHDSAVSECNECRVKFNLVERKHHCRNCGNVFCAKCTNKKHAIPELSFFQPVRVCNSCHVVLSNPKGIRPTSPLQPSS